MTKSGYKTIKILPPGSTGADLQNAVDNAAFGDVIKISDNMLLENPVNVPLLLEITVCSDVGNNWVMSQTTSGTRHFEIDGSLILKNITLNGGGTGGGVQVNQGAFALREGVVIQNCAAVSGGGVHVTSGVFAIYGGTVQHNTAQKGGGVYMSGGTFNMSASEGIIKNNIAGGSGGGIYIENGNTLSFSGDEISANEAANGGGVYVDSSTFAMSGGVVMGNTVSANGGGIYVAAGGTLEINGLNPRVMNNNAPNGNGGGIYTEDTGYGNITTGINLMFRCNKAFGAFNPPSAELYPNIRFASVSVTGHPLNNFDINYMSDEPAGIVCNVNYNANGGEGSHTGPDIPLCGTDTVFTRASAEITYEGHNFICWNTKADGTGTSYAPGDIITLTGNITLYAQWQAEVYTAAYTANGGSGLYLAENIAHGTEYIVLTLAQTQISWVGHTFTGWNSAPNGRGIPYSPGQALTITGDIILYAQWKTNLYGVIYLAGGGSGRYMDINITYGSKYVISQPETTKIKRKGYIFTGWNTLPDGSGTAYAPGDVLILTSSVLLYAQWAPRLYEVIYNANCGCGGYTDTNIPYGAQYILLQPEAAQIERKGYIFTGWNTVPNGCGTAYSPGDVLILGGNMTLYAQWQIKENPCFNPCRES